MKGSNLYELSGSVRCYNERPSGRLQQINYFIPANWGIDGNDYRTSGRLHGFWKLEAPRVDGGNKQQSLFNILFITLCATVARCETYTEVEQFVRQRHNWFRKFLKLDNCIPSHDTIDRVLAASESRSFQACLHDWIEHLCLNLRRQSMHIDGKTLRRSFDWATNRQALHQVSAWSSGLQVCLEQVATEEKSNEITAVPMLLELLNIEGAVVTLDAMNCQKRTVAKIRDRKADYPVTVKKNQRNLHQTIASQFTQFGEDNYRWASHAVRSVTCPATTKRNAAWSGESWN